MNEKEIAIKNSLGKTLLDAINECRNIKEDTLDFNKRYKDGNVEIVKNDDKEWA